jgi:5-(carboxyamino)imidazole ribonucleotide mutase
VLDEVPLDGPRAALLALAILGNKYPKFRVAYENFRKQQTANVLANPDPAGQREKPILA